MSSHPVVSGLKSILARTVCNGDRKKLLARGNVVSLSKEDILSGIERLEFLVIHRDNIMEIVEYLDALEQEVVLLKRVEPTSTKSHLEIIV